MNIAVFYHAFLNDSDQGIAIVHEQMAALQESGLAYAANELHIGAFAFDLLTVAALAPDNATMHDLGRDGSSELPTLRLLRDWLEPGWFVLYHHTKGVTLPGDPYGGWRRELEQVCVWRWRDCVAELVKGADTVGTRWIMPHPGPEFPPGQRYWAGNFWWARSEYLMQLKELVEPQFAHRTERENRYEAEVWIGKSTADPRIANLSP